jgi:hypothetical protein
MEGRGYAESCEEVDDGAALKVEDRGLRYLTLFSSFA